MLASIICGIIGTIVVEKKLVMMSGGIAHAAFGGVGMGYFLNISKLFTFDLKKIMLLSILFGVVFSLLGLYIS